MSKPWDETWTASGTMVVGKDGWDVLDPWARVDSLARARLAAAAPELVRALLAVEWIGPEAHRRCPCCEASDTRGHYNDCAIAAALRKAGVIL